MKTNFEKAFEKMTPAQRRSVSKHIGDMMGMPPKKRRTSGAKTRRTTKAKGK